MFNQSHSVVAHNLKIYMSIRTQTIEIYDDANPLEVRCYSSCKKGSKRFYCHEPYVLEAMKMYDKYCGGCSEVIIVI